MASISWAGWTGAHPGIGASEVGGAAAPVRAGDRPFAGRSNRQTRLYSDCATAACDQARAAGDDHPLRYTTVGAPCPMHAAACSTPAADTIFQGTEAAS